jgi:thioredoxin reductase/NAD-dependent dihydropyrimidine dehydrogenase PreA subunit
MLYVTPLLLVLWVHIRRRRNREVADLRAWREAQEAGLTEPTCLHPSIDPMICVGSGACVNACPEGALGIVNGKAQLVNPTICLGHGACAATCPVEAITLVFGTERRGVDIPQVKPTYETNVHGIFIAGELGGMGLVRKAAEQGRQAIETIRQRPAEDDQQLDVLIVGAGPAGLSATLQAMEHKLRFVTVEQEDSLGGTVYHYPRNKVVMTKPINLPLLGKFTLGESTKEGLLGFWQSIVDKVRMPIQFSERLEKITPVGKGFEVTTGKSRYRTRSILLAIGRRGTPRQLAVPGEDLPKVVYRLIDAAQYRGAHVLVVGGGDSAIEAAVSIANEAGAHVTLSYRGEAFGRVKPKNRTNLGEAEQAGLLTVLLQSEVVQIEARTVALKHGDQSLTLENDAVIVCAGGILPTPMLKDLGIMVETKFGRS